MTREAAIRILGQYDVNFHWTDGEPIPAAEVAAAVEMAIEAIKAMPVRCKECSYCVPEWPDDTSRVKKCSRGLGWVRPEDYCSKVLRRFNVYGKQGDEAPDGQAHDGTGRDPEDQREKEQP